MSTSTDRPVEASYENGRVQVRLENGLEFSFPIDGNPRLEGASAEALSAIELSPFGLHWPELDEDLSIRGLLSGDFGQRPGRAA